MAIIATVVLVASVAAVLMWFLSDSQPGSNNLLEVQSWRATVVGTFAGLILGPAGLVISLLALRAQARAERRQAEISVASPEPDAATTPSPSPQRPSRETLGQVVENSTAEGSINQVSGVRGSVHLGGPAVAVPPAASVVAPSGPAAPCPLDADQGATEGDDEGDATAPGGGSQHVGGCHASGSITQITGVGGDVTIERS